METYFGKATEEDLEISGTAEFFEKDGNYYYYKLVCNDEGFVIEDTCGRYLPLDKDCANEFATMGFVVSKYFDAHKEAESLLSKRLDQLQQLVDFWERNV